MQKIQAVIFDWGDTLMRDFHQYKGAMVYWPEIAVLPGVKDALEVLHTQYICCVASNAGDSDADLMGLALERGGIRQYFRYLWTSQELGVRKPDQAFFSAIQKFLALKPSSCVLVGNDYEKDIRPAKAAGFKTVWLASQSQMPTSEADIMITSMSELVTQIDCLLMDS